MTARELARAATAIENRTPEGLRLLSELAPKAGKARIIGLTGPPGAGKSTLVDALARAMRQAGRKVGIIAVDPTSRKTGGALLGDRVRMQAHHADPGIFIRSMATRGETGGLARATADVAMLLDAEGMDYVIVETVGVGQDELAITAVAQITIVVLVPGMGDDIQASKAGIMEIADIFVINKADHPGTEQVEREIHANSNAPIVKTVATEGTGVAELLAAIERTPVSAPSLRTRQYTIDHLGIAVKSIDQALTFYQGQLGLPAQGRETVAQEKVNVAMLPVGGPRIELLEATGPESVIAKFIEKRGEGLHHVAIRVPDLRAAVARLKQSGARLLNEPSRGAGGHEYVFVHPSSTGGVLLELIQES